MVITTFDVLINVARHTHISALRGHTQVPTWRDETSGLAFDGPIGEIGGCTRTIWAM